MGLKRLNLKAKKAILEESGSGWIVEAAADKIVFKYCWIEPLTIPFHNQLASNE